MVKRTCPACGEPVYSSAEQEPVWICPTCGEEVPKESEDRDWYPGNDC